MNPDRIRQARELAGLKQADLAKRIGIAQSAIAQIESGQFTPSVSIQQAIALHTGFDLSFLRRPDPPAEFPVGSILYRSKAKVAASDKARAHRFAQLLFEFVCLLKTKLRPIPVLLPRLNNEDPMEAARMTRSSLGLSPDTPIPNIMSAIERAGVLVLHLPLEIEGLDGFSAWVGKNHEMPVICLLGKSIGYRLRYTLSEELGHLVMHAPLRTTADAAEEEVKLFTSEFVLPADAMRREMLAPVTLASLAPLRSRWGASVQFLAVTSHRLAITTPNQYRYLMQQVSIRGWRTQKKEPGDETVPQERPVALRKMLEVVYGKSPDLKQIRRDTGVPMGILKVLLTPGDNPPPSNVVVLHEKKSKEA